MTPREPGAAAVGFTRDASWFNHPDVTRPKKVHRDSPAESGTPACRPGRVLLVMDAPVDVTSCLPASLCRRCFPPTGSAR